MTPREPGGARTLTAQQVKDTTVEFFAEQGFRGASLDGVAERLGVTRQALYHYYKRKHDILYAICDDLMADLEAAVTEAADGPDDPVARLRAMVEAYVLVVASRPTYSAVVTRDFTFLPAREERAVRDRRRDLTGRFLEVMEDAVARGLVRDVPPEVSVSLILGAANWTYRWFRPSAATSAKDLAGMAADLLLEGVLLTPPTRRGPDV